MSTNAPVNRALELTAFRGAFLLDTVDVMGEARLECAHENLLPLELLAYGRELAALGGAGGTMGRGATRRSSSVTPRRTATF